MNTRSLRFRLIAWYAGLLMVVFLLLGALLFLRLETFLEDNALDTQSRRARQIAETLLVNVEETGEPYVVNQIGSLYAPELVNRFIRITRQDGSVLYVSGPPSDQSFDPAVVPAPPASPRREFTRKQPLPDGRSLLIAAVRTASADRSAHLVEVGTAAAPVETTLQQVLLLMSAGLPTAVLLAIGGGWLLVRRALAPVDQIAGTAAIITQHNLSERLPVARTGDELERLSVSLNHMITRLDEAFQTSKRFVADASHELRTPLTVLRGELEHLVQEARLSADHRERLGSLLEEVERLSQIVERLLALSRLDAGEAQTEWAPLDLGELAATTASQMALLAEDKQIALTCAAAAPVPVRGDRARLKQVVVNLLDNAIKYTPERGAVHLRVAAMAGQAVLEVADTGVGIPSESLPHVFERFFRVDQARSRQPDGAGLGLAIVKSICHAHGEVTVKSALNRGSRFRVSLPLANGKAHGQSAN
jgi:heavy metal sensor kinase